MVGASSEEELPQNVADASDVAVSCISSIGGLGFRVMFSASETGQRGVEEQSRDYGVKRMKNLSLTHISDHTRAH